jgi:hypothetical protein
VRTDSYLWTNLAEKTCVCVPSKCVCHFPFAVMCYVLSLQLPWSQMYEPVAYREGVREFNPPPTLRNFKVLTQLSRIPSSVENTSVTT